MPDYQLLYFPARGRAEQVRLLLAVQGISFKESAPSDWATQKPSTPFGFMPLLTEHYGSDEFTLAESGAILRHLARRYDLYGRGLKQHAMCDALADHIADLRTKYIPIAYASTFKTSPEATAEFFNQLPVVLGFLERAHSRSQDPQAGWFIGSSLTFADVTAFDYLDGLEKLQPTVLDNFPALKGFVARFRELPNVAAFLTTRTRP